MKKGNNQNKMLPFHVISAATNGDIDAMNTILKHYNSYITRLSTRSVKDADGKIRSYVDEDMCNRLKIRLIMRTLEFAV